MHQVYNVPRLLLIGVHAPYNTTSDIQAYFDEFIHLVKSNDLTYTDAVFLKLRTIEPSTFLTKGHVETIEKICQEKNIDEVLFSEPLTPQQERNLSEILHARVFDRTQLILEIFEKAAISAEGKLQVEIAMLEHQKSRLAGKGKHLAQQRGILGLRAGFGETLKERERRHLEQRMLQVQKKLDHLEKVRETQRKQRLKSKMPLMCLIGYTNAGKSTILNALTKSDVLAQDKLFATLDTTTKELYVDSQKLGLISDTVGFIQLLPPQLVDAFKSTLAELQYADLLLHVIDIADPDWQTHISVVQKILHDLDVDKDVLYVFNKADKIELTEDREAQLNRYRPHVVVSAIQKDGLEPLKHYIKTYVAEQTIEEKA